jgi:exosome complex RNA-binding protein Csl4
MAHTVPDHNVGNLLRNDFYTVRVKYDNTSQLYTFKVHTDLVVIPGDLVLVETRENKGTYRSVEVVKVDPVIDMQFDSDIRYKWVVSKIDDTRYAELCSRDADDIIRAKQIRTAKRVAALRDQCGIDSTEFQSTNVVV